MSIDTEGYACWVNEEERILSFHQEPGFVEKEFSETAVSTIAVIPMELQVAALNA